MTKLTILFSCIAFLSPILRIKGLQFKEDMFIKPLPPSYLYVYLQFLALVDGDDSFQHSYITPRSLGEIVHRYQVDELHLTLTKGLWKHNEWGYPVLDAAPGAELYVLFSPDVVDVDTQWKKLSSALSGLFCVSLNLIDNMNTITPKMTLWPTGASSTSKHNITSQFRYASLPREYVCTENLTPWKKLLPCESRHGFASLLNSRMIYNTNYHSMGINVRRMCASSNCLENYLEMKQTIALVYEFKIIKTMDWSLRKLFGQGLPGACSFSSSSKIYVDITSNSSYPFKLLPEPNSITSSHRGDSETVLVVYNIDHSNMINIGAKYRANHKIFMNIPPPLSFYRYVLGHGREFGGIVTELTNNYWAPIDVVILENAPWWLPIQLSTLRINGEAESKLIMSQYYSPGRSRQKSHHLELLLKLPPKCTTRLTIDFELIFLKWHEYPPDANNGFHIGSALISANLPTARNYTSLPITGSTFDSIINASQPWYPMVFRTNGAIVLLPTPDFTMSYNVICLACTVVALAFKPLNNICTKELVLKVIGVSLRQKIFSIFKKKKD